MLGANLISVGQLLQSGFVVNFRGLLAGGNGENKDGICTITDAQGHTVKIRQ